LDQVLLLVKKQYSEEMLSCIGNKNLVCYHNDLKNKILDLEMRVEGKLLIELGNTMAVSFDIMHDNMMHYV
jgi:hypothetical protein